MNDELEIQAVRAAVSLGSEDLGATIAVGLGFGLIWPLVWGGIGFFQIRRAFAKMEVKVKKAEKPK